MRHYSCAALARAVLLAVLIAAFGATAAQANTNYSVPVPAPGGVQMGNSVYYDSGNVIYTPNATATSLGCESGWVCLFRDSDFNGDRWRFQSKGWQNLRDYGASDEVSSWWNNRSNPALLGKDAFPGGPGEQLYMSAKARASGMGGFNDQASSVDAWCYEANCGH